MCVIPGFRRFLKAVLRLIRSNRRFGTTYWSNSQKSIIPYVRGPHAVPQNSNSMCVT